MALLILFWLVYEVFKQNYDFTDTVIDISYNFHADPIIICDNRNVLKVNKRFTKIFEEQDEFEYTNHYTQILNQIKDANKLQVKEFGTENSSKISIEKILLNKEIYKGKSFSVISQNSERVLTLNIVELENIYDTKTIYTFADTTEFHNLEKEQTENKYKSVLMGCLTHELRTPVNLVISGLNSLEFYVINPNLNTESTRKLFKI